MQLQQQLQGLQHQARNSGQQQALTGLQGQQVSTTAGGDASARPPQDMPKIVVQNHTAAEIAAQLAQVGKKVSSGAQHPGGGGPPGGSG
ncbi:unnamed protein product, partial [Amoebophrya sp. A25]|eukprot:GSA25T00022099001.1